jgi:hypothetical protein
LTVIFTMRLLYVVHITDQRFFLGMFPEMVSVVVSRRPICAYGGAGGGGGDTYIRIS